MGARFPQVVMKDSSNVLTGLPGQNEANQKALDEFVPVLYAELRRLASSYLHHERRDHTLQTTALVHEAYLRLLSQRSVPWESKNQFLGIAAQLMRRILVDYGRKRHAMKRGGEAGRVFVQEAEIAANQACPDVVVLDEALTKLGKFDPLQARIVELRFFGGLNIDQIAEVTGISARTVKRNWRLAKARLARELQRDKQNG